MQLGTQLAAILACWGGVSKGFSYLWLSVAMKALAVGVVSMQRLDDARLVRCLCFLCLGPRNATYSTCSVHIPVLHDSCNLRV